MQWAGEEEKVDASLTGGGFTPEPVRYLTKSLLGSRFVNTSNDASNTNPNATSVIAQYQHNGFGERVWKRTTGNGPNNPANDERYFVYDEDGYLSGEYGANGILIQETVWLDDTPVAMLSKPANASTAASIANSAVVYRIWSDHLDTPRTITAIDANNNAANQAVWSGDSDAFGNTLPATTIGNLNVSTLEYNLRFPGQYFDIETSRHYNYFRDYNPSSGRYAQTDPMGLREDLNLYAYVASRPLTFIDPDGLARVRPPKPPNPPGKPGPKKGLEGSHNQTIAYLTSLYVMAGGSVASRGKGPHGGTEVVVPIPPGGKKTGRRLDLVCEICGSVTT